MVENRCFCIIIMLYNCNVKGTVSKNFWPLKGQCLEIFDPRFFSSIDHP
jgi:hypothetical protein